MAAYRAQLHELELQLHGAHGHGHSKRGHDDDVEPASSLVLRVPLVAPGRLELWAHGVRVNYRGDSLQPADEDRGDACNSSNFATGGVTIFVTEID